MSTPSGKKRKLGEDGTSNRKTPNLKTSNKSNSKTPQEKPLTRAKRQERDRKRIQISRWSNCFNHNEYFNYYNNIFDGRVSDSPSEDDDSDSSFNKDDPDGSKTQKEKESQEKEAKKQLKKSEKQREQQQEKQRKLEEEQRKLDFVYDDELEEIVSIQKKPVDYWDILLKKLQKVVESISNNAIQNLDTIIEDLRKGNFRYHAEKVLEVLLYGKNSRKFWKLDAHHDCSVLLSYEGDPDLSLWFAKATEMVKVMNILKCRENEKTKDEKDKEWEELKKELETIQSNVENIDSFQDYTSESDDDNDKSDSDDDNDENESDDDNDESTETSCHESVSVFNPDDDYATGPNDINAQIIDPDKWREEGWDEDDESDDSTGNELVLRF